MLNFVDIPQQSGGWFKPSEHQGAVAILVEVKGFDRQRPTPNGPKDSALTDLSIFNSQADLDAGTPTEVKGVRIEQTVLARDLAGLVNSATVVTVTQVPNKKPGAHPAWVWRPVERAVMQKVVEYANKREQAVQAAVAAAPDFD
ncbi:hypothetical protein ALI22I_34040 [Saccharothrix sp. ALI-22-I]|uniref:hypothetical protein n=1 Tax=Saccharothrix sp. ALI-22-I TaxID=1933778 RepID=UPI00097CB1BB|nr:hypothetical protein [Saccharothrix sp. ALI-22-I]ONI83516.1 hypothetical protein ALI22I_34040 [Saccharothrix sp. ALI-22-I]